MKREAAMKERYVRKESKKFPPSQNSKYFTEGREPRESERVPEEVWNKTPNWRKSSFWTP